MRNIFFLLILILFTAMNCHARGSSGKYFVKGKAYGPLNILLKNMELEVYTGDTLQIIRTDSEGNYEFEVKWETACASQSGKVTVEEININLNPDIRISFNRQEIILKNEWKKFSRVSDQTKENLTMMEDLIFKDKKYTRPDKTMGKAWIHN